jgi:hypothetical protein
VQAAYRGTVERRKAAALKDSQKRALAELLAKQQEAAQQAHAEDKLFTRQLPMDARHRLERLLNKPRSSVGALLTMCLLIATIVLSLASFFLATMPEYREPNSDQTIRDLEAVCAAIFTAELLLRIYVATLDLKRMLFLDLTFYIDVRNRHSTEGLATADLCRETRV